MIKISNHQISVAAEAFAAGMFAQAGCSVFVQYGANEPGFDLMVSRGHKMLQISVKGSNNGGWILTLKKKDGTYIKALNEWAERNKEFIFCLVQFDGVDFGKMPRMYLVEGNVLAIYLETHAYGGVSLSLVENRAPKKGRNKGNLMNIPQDWTMTYERIVDIFNKSIGQ